MKNFLFALLAVVTLYSCNSSTGDANNNNNASDSTATAPTSADQSLPTNAVTDPNITPNDPPPGNAAFTFETMDHDFGKIPQTQKVEYTFKFTNTGTEPLIISEAKGTCGCTVPDYSKEPIPVGGTGEIQVSFDPAGKSGIQRKSVIITANTNPIRTTLNLTSDIIAADAPPAQ